METQLREFEAAAEACAPVRFMGAMVVDLLVKLDVRNDWKQSERERAATTASKGVAWSHRDGFPDVVTGLVCGGGGASEGTGTVSIPLLGVCKPGCRGKWVALPDRTPRAGSV